MNLEVKDQEMFDDKEVAAAKTEVQAAAEAEKKAEPDSPPPKEEQQRVAKVQAIVPAGRSGELMGRDIDSQWRLATAFHKSRLLPAAFDSVEKVLAGMQFCYELGLKPITGMRQIMIVNGTPSLWGDLPLALVRKTGELMRFEEFFFDKENKPLSFENGNHDAVAAGAVCRMTRKGGESVERIFTVEMAKLAGLIDKNKSLWKIYPKRMLQMRVRGWAIKDLFSDVLMGAPQMEYDYDTTVVEGEIQGPVKPNEKDVAAELNRTYLDDKTPTAPESGAAQAG